MMMKKLAGPSIALALVVGLVAGCKTTGVTQANDLATSLDKASEGFVMAEGVVSNALVTLNSLAIEQTDLAATYPVLKKQAAEFASIVERIKKGNEKVRTAGKARFDSWKVEIDAIQNADMKKESLKRMEDSIKKHEDILKLLNDADPVLDPLVSNLSDIVKYLELDLSKAGVKSLSGGIKDANKSGEKVQKWLGEVSKELAALK